MMFEHFKIHRKNVGSKFVQTNRQSGFGTWITTSDKKSLAQIRLVQYI